MLTKIDGCEIYACPSGSDVYLVFYDADGDTHKHWVSPYAGVDTLPEGVSPAVLDFVKTHFQLTHDDDISR